VDGTIEKWRDRQGTVRTMPMHGFSREIAFAVIPSADNVLQMRLQESAASLEYYPFPFQFDVIYRLSTDSLEVEFAVTNTGDQPLPYYAGHHFYFAIPRQERGLWELETPFVRTGRQNADGSVTEQSYSASTARLDQPELVDRYLIGPTQPTFSLRRSTDHRTLQFKLDVPGSVPWYAVTTWTEKPESDFYCVEPWLGLPNAIHHELGLRWVQPGQTERSICLIKDSVS
jgi:galactose mutarotase-like enzyme